MVKYSATPGTHRHREGESPDHNDVNPSLFTRNLKVETIFNFFLFWKDEIQVYVFSEIRSAKITDVGGL